MVFCKLAVFQISGTVELQAPELAEASRKLLLVACALPPKYVIPLLY